MTDTNLPPEDVLLNDLRNIQAVFDEKHDAAKDKDRDSLSTLRLRNLTNEIFHVIVLIERDILNGEFDFAKYVRRAEFNIWDMEDKLKYSLNTADNCVFRGVLEGSTAVLEVLNANKFNFPEKSDV